MNFSKEYLRKNHLLFSRHSIHYIEKKIVFSWLRKVDKTEGATFVKRINDCLI